MQHADELAKLQIAISTELARGAAAIEEIESTLRTLRVGFPGEVPVSELGDSRVLFLRWGRRKTDRLFLLVAVDYSQPVEIVGSHVVTATAAAQAAVLRAAGRESTAVNALAVGREQAELARTSEADGVPWRIAPVHWRLESFRALPTLLDSLVKAGRDELDYVRSVFAGAESLANAVRELAPKTPPIPKEKEAFRRFLNADELAEYDSPNATRLQRLALLDEANRRAVCSNNA
ncbi:MAG: hypothetical protein AB1716_11980 [Planctomycetota bacterium]